MVKEIKLKTDFKFFKEIFDNNKNFEVRLDDKNIKEGDILVLLEKKDSKLTGREIRKKVNIDKFGFIVAGFE